MLIFYTKILFGLCEKAGWPVYRARSLQAFQRYGQRLITRPGLLE